jgi:hypothetical protein
MMSTNSSKENIISQPILYKPILHSPREMTSTQQDLMPGQYGLAVKLLILIQLLCLFNKVSGSILLFSLTAQADGFELNKIYSNSECLSCHKESNPDLINTWRNSSHSGNLNDNNTSGNVTSGKVIVDCVQCHGISHKDAAAKSRSDVICINCHGGNKAPVVHSYKTSKHGAIMQMTKKKLDWDKPLKLANYRVPGCAYCHMHNTQHNTKKSIRQENIFETLSETLFKTRYETKTFAKNNLSDKNFKLLLRQTGSVCSNCHAPRYIRRLFENGERMLAIARKKMIEAQLLVDSVLVNQAKRTANYSDDKVEPVIKQYHKMKTHYHNVYLGIAHQSPDYQWWHGQPALDGDLLKIKALICDLQRAENIRMVSD